MNQAIIPDYLKDIVVFNPDAYNQDREELKAVTNNSHVLNQNKDAYIEGAQVGMYHFPQSRILTNEFRAIVVLRSTGIRAWKGQQFVVTREDNGTLFENQKEIATALKLINKNADARSQITESMLEYENTFVYTLAVLDDQDNITNVVDHYMKGNTGLYADERFQKALDMRPGPSISKIYKFTGKVKTSSKGNDFMARDITFCNYLNNEDTYKSLDQLSKSIKV